MAGSGLGVRAPIIDYVRQVGLREHPVLERCREETLRHPAHGMQIDPEQGALMQTLALATGAKRAIEVGVFTGYSSTAVALAMKQRHGTAARLVACDISQRFIDVAALSWKAAEVDELIEPRVGPAAVTLQAMVDAGEAGTYDFIFIDADKTGYGAYYELGLTLLRSGGLMLIDNMLWSGQVADPADRSADTEALRALAEWIWADERVDATLATIGDGLSVVVKR